MEPVLAFFPSFSGDPVGIRLLWTAFSLSAAGLVAFLACFALADRARSVSQRWALCVVTFAPHLAGVTLIPVASGYHLGLDAFGVVAFSLPLSVLMLLLAAAAHLRSRRWRPATRAVRGTRITLALGTAFLSVTSIILHIVLLIR